ncbi:carbohydrate ABC transporter permease [Inhella proteolytica]|uniref:Sugar ABC transporter permease n=1 Tax=Inhella proteolytica TaxID=2795029 RepID=A0A931NFL6_9BURK|nr:sugar ABC transporter permease [Inhella proteolytica]MBH9576226.1 sugar ABC transporter permease [Inhella proteolytica]
MTRFFITARSAPYWFLAPFLLLFAVFGLFPLLFSLGLAFARWEPTSGMGAMEWVGLENFVFALQDEWFWKSLGNTLWLGLASALPQHLIAVPLACALNGLHQRARNTLVGIYFMPYITSTVAIAILFSSLFSTDYGLINAGLKALRAVPGLDWLLPAQAIDWLNDPDRLKPAIATVVFWRFVGFNTVLYLAALQTIPRDLYEAATMDGAGRWQRFVYITLPGLKAMLLFGVTLSVIGSLQLFEEPFILTNGRGGNDQAGMTSAVYLYRLAFDFNDFGAASAMAWLLFALLALATWATQKAFGERA